MRLSIAQAVGLVSEAAWAGRPPAAGFTPTVDPRLVASYSSRLHSPTPPPWQAEPDPFWGPPKVPPSDREAAADPGLVGCAQFDHFAIPNSRYGFKGLTAKGKARLQQGSCLLEERRACCGFWTIALPDVVLAGIRDLDTWPAFQSSIRRRLARLLRQCGVTAQLVGVVEIHPKRSAEAGQALPHLHVLFRGKEHRWQQWALSPADLDLIVRWAIWDADVFYTGPLTGCQVEPVKKSVRRYMAKYITKGVEDSQVGSMDNSDVRLIPRQWHFSSREVIELIKATTKPLPSDFLCFLLDRRKANSKGQLYHAHQLEISDPRAPVIWRIAWRSPWALFLTVEAWERARYCGERDTTCMRNRDCSVPGFNPVSDQHL